MYNLHLTADDCRVIAFIGRRYQWSKAIEDVTGLCAGRHRLSEPEAWILREAVEADTEGGHIVFPMLNPHSKLSVKLIELCEKIV